MKPVLFSFLIIGLATYTTLATEYKPAPPTLEAKDYTSWKSLVNGCRRAEIYADVPTSLDPNDSIKMIRLDLVGDAKSRGYCHGYLLAEEIVEFTGPQLDKFYASEVLNLKLLNLSAFPEPLQKILGGLRKGLAIEAPKAFNDAMAWVWEKEKSYVPSYLIDEIAGIAQGMCDKLSKAHIACDPEAWAIKIQNLNMLPELIRMTCTAFGAWGEATATKDTLVQLRALDFGEGPWVNYTVVAVHRGIPNNNGNSFVSVSFPAFVGVITGISSRGVGISEKVWENYNKFDLQPGSYDGEADVFVLRDILEKSLTKADAEAYINKVQRSWGIWAGIGDYDSLTFDLVTYSQQAVTVYTDATIGQVTGQPMLKSIAYVDKHPQPSGEGPNGSLPTVLTDLYGQISLETTKTVTQYHQSGDVHIASYDYAKKEMNLAIGRINKEGRYQPEGGKDDSEWKAYNRPYFHFNLEDLWAGL
jgi:hypothetical protein